MCVDVTIHNSYGRTTDSFVLHRFGERVSVCQDSPSRGHPSPLSLRQEVTHKTEGFEVPDRPHVREGRSTKVTSGGDQL